MLKVIAAESEAFFRKDFAAFSDCWLHDPHIRRLGWWTRGGVTDRWGWDSIGERARLQMLDHPDPNATEQAMRRENVVVRVCGDMAWATFDQYAIDTGEPDIDMPGLSRESRVLEKHDGQWRIVYHTYIHHSAEPERSAMFRVDSEGRVSFMNKSAEQFIKSEVGLKLSAGRLRARTTEDSHKLAAAIAEASERDARLDGSRAPTPIVIDTGAPDEVCVCWVMTEYSGTGTALVSINNLLFAQDQIDAAALAFGLSSTQQRVAELIVAGKDLVRSAAQLGVSLNTVRTHLQRIFEKTGVRSQPALVRVLLSTTPPS